MPKLKDQLKLILPKLSEEANHNRDPEVKFRLYALKAIVGSTKDIKKACEAKGVSTDFFYEWGGRLLRVRKLSSLKSRSRKPKKSPSQTPKRVEKRIRRLRVAEPAYGPERISFYLKRLFNITCAPSSVYNVLRRLNFVSRSERKTRSKKHLKRYTRPVPGYLQMDIKYVPYLVEGKTYYEWNAVDHHSSWRLIRAYKDKSHESLVTFLAELEKECPFAIIQVQTDNGVEFTDKYRVNSDGHPTGWHPLDMWCTTRDIEHKLIPIGVKELNGKVENTHGFDDREFYSRYKETFKNYASLEHNIRGWNEQWNGSRHTAKLGWRTPNEVIANAYLGYIAFWLTWCERHQPLARINDQAVFELPIMAVPLARKSKGPKHRTAVDRYLNWMEGEEKKSLKSVIVVPAMSQILSKLLFLLGALTKGAYADCGKWYSSWENCEVSSDCVLVSNYCGAGKTSVNRRFQKATEEFIGCETATRNCVQTAALGSENSGEKPQCESGKCVVVKCEKRGWDKKFDSNCGPNNCTACGELDCQKYIWDSVVAGKPGSCVIHIETNIDSDGCRIARLFCIER